MKTIFKKHKMKFAVVMLGGVLFFSFQNFTNLPGYVPPVISGPVTVAVANQVHANCAKLAINSVRNQKASNIKHVNTTYHCKNNRGDYFLTKTQTYASSNTSLFEKQILTSAIVRPSVSGNTTLSPVVTATWKNSGTNQMLPVLTCPSLSCNKPNMYLTRGKSFLKIPGIFYGNK